MQRKKSESKSTRFILVRCFCFSTCFCVCKFDELLFAAAFQLSLMCVWRMAFHSSAGKVRRFLHLRWMQSTFTPLESHQKYEVRDCLGIFFPRLLQQILHIYIYTYLYRWSMIFGGLFVCFFVCLVVCCSGLIQVSDGFSVDCRLLLVFFLWTQYLRDAGRMSYKNESQGTRRCREAQWIIMCAACIHLYTQYW